MLPPDTALGRALGVDGKTIRHDLDPLVDLLPVRQLQPLVANAGMRLVKAQKVYVRDSGLVHTLLGLDSADAVLGHPVADKWPAPLGRSRLQPALRRAMGDALRWVGLGCSAHANTPPGASQQKSLMIRNRQAFGFIQNEPDPEPESGQEVDVRQLELILEACEGDEATRFIVRGQDDGPAVVADLGPDATGNIDPVLTTGEVLDNIGIKPANLIAGVIERVEALTQEQRVAAGATTHKVFAITGIDEVIAGATAKEVVERRATNLIIASAAMHVISKSTHRGAGGGQRCAGGLEDVLLLGGGVAAHLLGERDADTVVVIATNRDRLGGIREWVAPGIHQLDALDDGASGAHGIDLARAGSEVHTGVVTGDHHLIDLPLAGIGGRPGDALTAERHRLITGDDRRRIGLRWWSQHRTGVVEDRGGRQDGFGHGNLLQFAALYREDATVRTRL